MSNYGILSLIRRPLCSRPLLPTPHTSAIIACHHVTGPWSYLVQIRAASLDAVEDFLSELKSGGWIARSETMLALSTVVEPPFRYRG